MVITYSMSERIEKINHSFELRSNENEDHHFFEEGTSL